MSSPSQQVQIRPLRRGNEPGAFDVYCAGLEWGLVDPIIINDRDDLKSTPPLARTRSAVSPPGH
jgi:hypothetical protein